MKHTLKLLFAVICLLVLSSCINEELEIDPVAQGDLIEESSELFQFLAQVTQEETTLSSVTCIDFIYPFLVYTYDDTDQYVSASRVGNDFQFYQYLQSIPEGYSVGISFPIIATLADGTEFEITNADQLAENIKGCIRAFQQAVLGTVNEEFAQCGWEVRAPEGLDPDNFEFSVFEVEENGGVVFYNAGTGSPGTWIFYFIANQLHMNINLDGLNDSIDETWNKDWIVTNYSAGNFQITNEDLTYDLNKICEPEIYCTTLVFEACVDENDDPLPPFQGTFNFEDYSRCISIIADQPIPEEYRYEYFETLEAAELFINPLPQDGYVNTENPQPIYTRITSPDGSEYEIVEITLLVIECD